MNPKTSKSVAIIVAHPDDETLWAGGTILSHPSWNCYIACLSRGSDVDRAGRFQKALMNLKSEGIIGDMDDGPDQTPLTGNETENAIVDLLSSKHFDLIITHNPCGEYTRHLRHEEVSKSVINLWHTGKISASELWTFAYEDGYKEYYPKAVDKASIFHTLIKPLWNRKYNIITKTYGFEKDSWEAQTTPRAEAFWQFTEPEQAKKWLDEFENVRV